MCKATAESVRLLGVDTSGRVTLDGLLLFETSVITAAFRPGTALYVNPDLLLVELTHHFSFTTVPQLHDPPNYYNRKKSERAETEASGLPGQRGKRHLKRQ